MSLHVSPPKARLTYTVQCEACVSSVTRGDAHGREPPIISIS